MPRFAIVREYWKHGDVDAEEVVAEFDTRAEADAYIASASGQVARSGPVVGTEGILLRIEERDG